MGSVFKFKQFVADQNGCAMKINTDGVLLGAIAVKRDAAAILDIGTGTGVIALMLAQRFPGALVDAVEIDERAAKTAALNFTHSIFADRVRGFHCALASYETSLKYDLIVSNPPYFVNNLKNQEVRKGLARHADENFFELMLIKVAELLNENGCFWLILPVKQAELVVSSAKKFGLLLSKQINICSDEHKPVIRHIICLTRIKQSVIQEIFYIYEAGGGYTDAYRFLLKDFFLAF